MSNSFVGKSKATKSVLTVIEAAWDSGATVPYLIGPPGIGKTAMIEALAVRLGVPLYTLLGSTMDPTDVGGLPALKQIILEDGTPAMVTENTLNYWAEELIRTGKGILFLDELTTSTPAVQAALLTLLQGRKVGRHTIPSSVHFIAAANPPDQAADGYELSPPMANRLLHIDFEPDNDDYLEGMRCAWLKEGVSQAELDERIKIVAFLQNYPSLMNAMPSDATLQGGAWPSYRSWDNLSRVLSKIDSKDQGARRVTALGLVGEAAQTQYSLFEQQLKLPRYEDVMSAPKSIAWKDLNPSESYVVLTMVLNRMNKENVDTSCEVFSIAIEAGEREDVGVALGLPIIHRVKDCVAGDQVHFTKLIGSVLRNLAPYFKDADIK